MKHYFLKRTIDYVSPRTCHGEAYNNRPAVVRSSGKFAGLMCIHVLSTERQNAKQAPFELSDKEYDTIKVQMGN